MLPIASKMKVLMSFGEPQDTAEIKNPNRKPLCTGRPRETVSNMPEYHANSQIPSQQTPNNYTQTY
jgi:hypothetical protein